MLQAMCTPKCQSTLLCCSLTKLCDADDLFAVARVGDTDNLVYGSPYRLAQCSYVRAAWAGLQRIPATFAAALFKRESRLRSAFGIVDSRDTAAPPLADRYFAKQKQRAGKRFGAASRALTAKCAHLHQPNLQ